MQFLKNEITLRKIKHCISNIGVEKNFINILFRPLKKPASEYFLGARGIGYIGKNKKSFMTGNYLKKNHKNRSPEMFDDFIERLQNKDIFDSMIESVKNITVTKPLNAEHEVFGLIELDSDIMPENFRKSLEKFIKTGYFYEALFFLILWSISGECIEKFSFLYESFQQIHKKNIYKAEFKIRLLSNIKVCRPVFKGRDVQLLQMHEHFWKKGHFLFLQGMGGIGKSELSKRYAETYKADYDVIVFVECGDSLVSAVNDDNKFIITEPFVLMSADETEEQYFMRKLNKLKEITEKTLIILDNIDYFSKELEIFLSVPFDVIITTRYNYFPDYPENTMIIGRIEDNRILSRIFSEYYGRNVTDDPFTDKIINMFEGHTMAIELVAKQAKASSITPEKMYEILENNEETELSEVFRMQNYDSKQKNIVNHLTRLFNIASLDDEEKYIMMCLSLIPLTGMEKNIFRKCCNLSNFSAMNRLAERSWIREAEGFVSCHALIQETIKITLKTNLIKCIDFINRLMEESPAGKFYHSSYQEKSMIAGILEHIYKCFPEPQPELYDFYEWLELIFNHYKKNNISYEIANRLLPIYREKFGENHFRTARIMCRIACIYVEFYNIEEAIKNLEKGKQIIVNLENKSDKEILYISDIDVTLTNLYVEQQNLSDEEIIEYIEPLCNEIIEIRTELRKTSIAPESLHLAVPYRNLAWVSMLRNDYEKVFEYVRKSSEECEKYGSVFDYYLIEYFNSQMELRRKNIYSAINNMKSAINTYIKYFGKYNFRYIRLSYELGDLYRQTGNNENARIYYEEALEYIQNSGLCLGLHDEIKNKLEEIS